MRSTFMQDVLDPEQRVAHSGRSAHFALLALTDRLAAEADEVCRRRGVTFSQYVALASLCEAEVGPAGVPMATVTTPIPTSASEKTRLADRLERAGLAERMPNPADRRSVLLRATEDGRAIVAALEPELVEFHRSWWSRLPVDQLDELHRLLALALEPTSGPGPA